MIRKIFLIAIILSTITVSGKPSPVLKKDNSKIEAAPVPYSKIEKFRNSNDFKYIKLKAPTNFWNIIYRYLLKFLKNIFSNRGAIPYIRYFIFTLIIVFILIKLFDKNITAPFSFRKNLNSEVMFDDLNINENNFDNKINEAIQIQNWNLALRYLYLKLLKKFNKHELINWQIGKTNKYYLNNLQQSVFYKDFQLISYYYEYCWYGGFIIERKEFDKLNKKFSLLYKSLDENR